MTADEFCAVHPHDDDDKFWCDICGAALLVTSAKRHLCYQVHNLDVNMVKEWVLIKDFFDPSQRIQIDMVCFVRSQVTKHNQSQGRVPGPPTDNLTSEN